MAACAKTFDILSWPEPTLSPSSVCVQPLDEIAWGKTSNDLPQLEVNYMLLLNLTMHSQEPCHLPTLLRLCMSEFCVSL